MTALKHNETILFIGDSITDRGRMEPQYRPLGCGYVEQVAAMLTMRHPEKSINVINTGTAGNTIEDLRDRWCDDVLSHQPDWLSIAIGINDCHRWIGDQAELHGPEMYEERFDELLTLTIEELPNIQLLIIDPFYAGKDIAGKLPGAQRNRIAEALPRYLEATERMSHKYGARHVRTHQLFKQLFETVETKVFFPYEPVHPNTGGHLFIAEAVYKELC